jgi:HK97 family phage major capsid protein
MPETKPNEKGEVIVRMEDLKGILQEALKGMDLPQIQALKDEMARVHKQAIFPSGEGTIFETCGKSVVDLGYYQKKAFLGQAGGSKYADGTALGARLRGNGGPWLSLSPVMQKFAKICACGADFQKIASLGISIPEYNSEVREGYKSVFGEKATDYLSTTDAGALVPTEYLAVVVEFATQESPILSKIWRIPMSAPVLKIPKLVQAAGSYFGGITLYHPGEGNEKTLTKPEFDTLTFTAKKLIGLIALSDELIADSTVNIMNYLTGLFVRAFRFKTEGEVVSGTGANDQMTGIIADANINEVKRTNSNILKYLDLINLESALDENFQDLTFLSRRASVNTLRKEKDTAGQPVYHDGFTTFLGGAMPPQLLGYPLIKTRNVPALGTRGDLILGDLSFYIWAMRQEMVIDTSKDWRFNYDQTAIRFVVRQDGAPGVSEAFAVLDDGLDS